MLLADLVFPQNLEPLTYSVPTDVEERLCKGQLVYAPLKNKKKIALVLNLYRADRETLPVEASKVKPIAAICDDVPAFHNALVELLKWVADYYVSSFGNAFKSMLFKELLKRPKKLKRAIPLKKGTCKLDVQPDSFPRLIETVEHSGGYKTIIYHAQKEAEEIVLSAELAERNQNAIILAPEIEDAEIIYTELLKRLPDRVCLYHSELKPSERYETLSGIKEGRYTIVVGTRSVVFVPIRPKIIIVTREHSLSYKQEESPRINARDTAVMRGYLEDVPVVLTTITPSTESYFNVLKKKYIYIQSINKRSFPRVSLVRLGKTPEIAPYITEPLYRRLKEHHKEGFLLIIQRLGYSMIRCEDCNELVNCPKCLRPMMYHRSSGKLLCHHCGQSSSVLEVCPACSGHRLTHYGAGTERIAHEVRKLTNAEIREKKDEANLYPGHTTLVGTLSRKGIRCSLFSSMAFLNPDIMLNQPYLKSTERFVQELYSLKESLREDGVLILQTYLPWHDVYKSIKNWNYMEFLKKTLRKRKELSLPPYRKIILIELKSKKPGTLHSYIERAKKRNAATVGPYMEEVSGKSVWTMKIILKGSRTENLHKICRKLLEEINSKELSVRVDVDPVAF